MRIDVVAGKHNVSPNRIYCEDETFCFCLPAGRYGCEPMTSHVVWTNIIHTSEYQLLCSATYYAKGAKEVPIVHAEEKGGVTIMLGHDLQGNMLPMQAITSGKTHNTLTKFKAPNMYAFFM